MVDDQAMLSKFGAGDLHNVNISIDDSDGYDLEGRREVREYAARITTGGWKLAHVDAESIWWEHPDPTNAATYRLEKKSAGWHGYRVDRQVSPSYTEDLQEALDGAAEWMAENPLEGVDE